MIERKPDLFYYFVNIVLNRSETVLSYWYEIVSHCRHEVNFGRCRG